MNFDAPDSNVACTRRRISDTPLQALNLLNDPVFYETAQALAVRAASEARGGFAERLDFLYQVCLARKPSLTERERLGKYFDQQSEILRKEGKPAEEAWTALSRVVLNLDEFITRE
jgi:hypothetical protein